MALNAKLSNPSYIFVNNEEEIFLTDYSFNCLRKITRNGNIFRIAGLLETSGGYNGDSFTALETRFNSPSK